MSQLRFNLGGFRTYLPLLVLGISTMVMSAESESPRRVISADSNWRFSLSDPKGAEQPGFDDKAWRTVTLPHDWSIEGKPEEKSNTGSGEGYYPQGIAWYRKAFTAPQAWKGKQVDLEFDGVAANADVYINGRKLGFHPNAYTSFHFDVTSQVKLSALNIIAVRVDNAKQPNSRWYTGSGIYRHVRFVVTDAVHVAPSGVFVSTPDSSAASSLVRISTQLDNASPDVERVTLETVITAPSGSQLPVAPQTVVLPPHGSLRVLQAATVAGATLWSPSTPTLYHATSTIVRFGRRIDKVDTAFGIRSVSWSVDKGLELNGSPIKLAGGSVHHDNGPLGAAAFDRAEERKAEVLKAAGFNAVRTAHNPPSSAFLDACDRLGLLVVDEPFDVWTVSKRKFDYAQYFNDWWQQDIDAMVERDRNHPSIIMWGIGNEIPEVWTSGGAPIAERISSRVRALDPTRPLTEAFPGATYGPNPDSVFAKVDIGGYNYNLAQNMNEDHRRVPGRIMMTTESFPADAFEQWQLVHDNAFVIGEFVWTAMDYLGESGIGAWSYGTPKQAKQSGQMKGFLRGYLAKMGADGKNPMAPFQEGQPPSPIAPGYPWHGSYCGDIDVIGSRKPWSHYRDILWNGGDRVFTTVKLPALEGQTIIAPGWSVYPSLPSWTWPGQEGKPLTVEVYSGTESVRLYLNDKLIGEKPTGRDQEFKADFEVPFEAGTLKVVGSRGGRDVAEDTLTTTGRPARLKLTADRTELKGDEQDLAFVTVETVDDQGHTILTGSQAVHFTAKGAGSVVAVGNGDTQSRDTYIGDTYPLFNGKGLVIIRTKDRAGVIDLTASADGLRSATIVLHSTPTDSRLSLK